MTYSTIGAKLFEKILKKLNNEKRIVYYKYNINKKETC